MNLAGESKMTQSLSIATGMSAGATESFVVVPFELVKIKLQDKKSTFKGPLEVVKTVIAKDGVLGLYAGLEATFWRYVYRGTPVCLGSSKIADCCIWAYTGMSGGVGTPFALTLLLRRKLLLVLTSSLLYLSFS